MSFYDKFVIFFSTYLLSAYDELHTILGTYGRYIGRGGEFAALMSLHSYGGR